MEPSDKRQVTFNEQQVLFLCTGNFYRSRFAEIYFNYLIRQNGLPDLAFSRGFEVFAGRNSGPISRHTLAYLEQEQIEIPEPLQFPVQLTDADFDKAGRIIALDQSEHLPMLLQYFPQREGQVQFWNFADFPKATSEQVLPAIRRAVEELVRAYFVS